MYMHTHDQVKAINVKFILSSFPHTDSNPGWKLTFDNIYNDRSPLISGQLVPTL